MKGFWDLFSEVVLKGMCCYCGACKAFCENIRYVDERPTADECYDCGMCYNVCPRTYLDFESMERRFFGDVRRDEAIGYYRRILAGRTLDEDVKKVCQDGGITTTLLIHLIESGFVDACVVATSEDWIPIPYLARSRDEIIRSAGSKYTQCPSVSILGKALDKGLRVAFVGLPCHVQAVRKLQSSDYDFNGEIALVVGLFCMETFDTKRFFEFVRGLGVKDVRKFDIKKGKFIVEGEERKEVPVKDMKGIMREACKYCTDFTAELADISVGSVGSKDGWNTVVLRSEAGERVFEDFLRSGRVEVDEVGEKGLNAIRKLADMKKSSAKRKVNIGVLR